MDKFIYSSLFIQPKPSKFFGNNVLGLRAISIIMHCVVDGTIVSVDLLNKVSSFKYIQLSFIDSFLYCKLPFAYIVSDCTSRVDHMHDMDNVKANQKPSLDHLLQTRFNH